MLTDPVQAQADLETVEDYTIEDYGFVGPAHEAAKRLRTHIMSLENLVAELQDVEGGLRQCVEDLKERLIEATRPNPELEECRELLRMVYRSGDLHNGLLFQKVASYFHAYWRPTD